jgi:allatostatin receptor
VLVVIVVFCVCWAPIQIILLLKALDLYSTHPPDDYPKIILQIFAHVLAYLNRYALHLHVISHFFKVHIF